MNGMNETPVANRLSIALFGRRNVGKSSLLNAMTGQRLSVISPVAGTTTDPVHKTMELLPLGPVVLTDTAGLDDTGELGRLRVEKTYEVLRKTDFAVLVADAAAGLTPFELAFAKELRARDIPALCVINKIDLVPPERKTPEDWSAKLGLPVVPVSTATGQGVEQLLQLISRRAAREGPELSLVEGLVRPGELAVLVTPIDKAAPKGRLILPQQQTIRDILECDAMAVVTKEQELRRTLERLAEPPAVVITDSQAFLKVSADTPPEVPMTSFSILFARQKGELAQMARGLRRIAGLRDGDRVLIAEGCTHHRQSDDIGKVKIPRWIRQMCGCSPAFEWVSGAYFPKDIGQYRLIVHCGACMLNRREMHYRLACAEEAGVGITNYGMLIAHVQGILHRALRPFPGALLEYEEDI